MARLPQTTLSFPPFAQERLKAFEAQIAGLQAQMQQFADGVLVGMGVDVLSNDVSVDMQSMTVAITPKPLPGDEPPPAAGEVK